MVYCFHQLQATHSKQTLLVTALYKACPRLTFLYTRLFCYYEIFLPILQHHFTFTEDGEQLNKQAGIWPDETKKENNAEAFNEVGICDWGGKVRTANTHSSHIVLVNYIYFLVRVFGVLVV